MRKPTPARLKAMRELATMNRAAFIAGAVEARKAGRQLDGTPDSRFPTARIDASWIQTNELRLLWQNAIANGFAEKPHGQAYRTELEKRNVLCVNCGEFYTRATPCFGHCESCIPRNEAAKIHTVDDLKAFQRRCGADV